jgi:hypothetical protein
MQRMVALHNDKVVLAVFKNSFRELVARLMPELSNLEQIGFLSAGASFGEFLRKEHLASLPKWEDLFFSRLQEQLLDVQHLLKFDLTVADEIATYLTDILEAYRGNRIGEFAFCIDQIEGRGSSVVALEAFDPPSVWQRVTNAERLPRQRVVLLIEDIKRVAGTSFEFQLQTATGSVGLLRDGAIHADYQH